MTPALMAARTLEQLANLDERTKLELLAWVKNRIQVQTGNAMLIAHDVNRESISAKAKLIIRDCDRFLAELQDLLKISKEDVR